LLLRINTMKRIPTEREILRCIYDLYELEYAATSTSIEVPQSNTAILAIDLEKIAERLNIKPELLFGILYYHLNKKYSYSHDNGVSVSFFFTTANSGDRRHSIRYPYLAAILAGMEQEQRKDNITRGLSIVAIVVSLSTSVVNWWSKISEVTHKAIEYLYVFVS
jgi:hypothetical protein